MSPVSTLLRRLLFGGLCLMVLLQGISCTGKGTGLSAAKQQAMSPAAPDSTTSLAVSPEEPPPAPSSLSLPPNFERHIDDLDEMAKRRNIRALVILNPIGFFYQNGLPKGAIYE